MSTTISIFTSKNLTEEIFYKFLESIGGKVQEVSGIKQGVLHSEDATIWLHYRGNSFNLDEDEINELIIVMNDAQTEIAIEISHSDNSKILAKHFCYLFLNAYGKIIIFNDNAEFSLIDDIDRVLHIIDN